MSKGRLCCTTVIGILVSFSNASLAQPTEQAAAGRDIAERLLRPLPRYAYTDISFYFFLMPLFPKFIHPSVLELEYEADPNLHSHR